jgi:SAM-dependent methyltransferase
MLLDPDLYDDIAESFDRYSERCVFPITECLMEMSGVRTGETLLDVACGSGIVTCRAAALVGPTGQAIGIDLSPGQIRVATRKAQAQKYHWTQFRIMDALQLEFADDSFDIVVAQFPHLPDRSRCLAEMFRVLKPGGRFAICNGGSGAPIWPLHNAPAPAEIPTAAIIDGLFRSCLGAHVPQLELAWAGNAPTQVADPHAALTNELERAGFGDIALWSYAYTAPFYTADDACAWEGVRISPYRMHKAKLDPVQVHAFEQEYLRQVQAKLDQYGVVGLTTAALFGVGAKPGV